MVFLPIIFFPKKLSGVVAQVTPRPNEEGSQNHKNEIMELVVNSKTASVITKVN